MRRSPLPPPACPASLTSFRAAVQQVQDARVLGGIHFRFATITGARMGHSVAWDTIAHLMRLLPAETAKA
jgi:hypothetical protein